MSEVKELCWLTTTRCNQKCKYCHRFVHINNLCNDEYIKVIKKLIEYGVKDLTFGGGEAMLVDNFTDIVDMAYDAGIKLKLVTNGILLLMKEYYPIINKMSIITLSIDSVSEHTNETLGRGVEHYMTIKSVLDLFRDMAVRPKIVINSVATKVNLDEFMDLSEFISRYPINHWRIFRFCPLRESALLNQGMFEIGEDAFQNLKDEVENLQLPFAVDFRNYEEMGKNYLLITPAGNLCVSNNLEDKVIGNILKDDLSKYFK